MTSIQVNKGEGKPKRFVQHQKNPAKQTAAGDRKIVSKGFEGGQTFSFRSLINPKQDAQARRSPVMDPRRSTGAIVRNPLGFALHSIFVGSSFGSVSRRQQNMYGN